MGVPGFFAGRYRVYWPPGLLQACAFCGCVLFAYFLGNVTAVITAANAAGRHYREKVEKLKRLVRTLRLGSFVWRLRET